MERENIDKFYGSRDEGRVELFVESPPMVMFVVSMVLNTSDPPHLLLASCSSA